MGEARVIEQAYRFALAPTAEQERFLSACAGASRFFYNWGLSLVEERLALRRAYGPSISVPWSYKGLCSEFAKVKDEVAPWRRDVVVGAQQAGFEALGAGLRRFLDGRRTGRRTGFPRYRRKGHCRESVIFQRPRIPDDRRVEFDRRLGLIRSRERFTKLRRLLERDEVARIKRATVQRHGSKWYVSFTVVRQPKRRRPRRPNTVVGVDVGLHQLATLSTGQQVANRRREHAHQLTTMLVREYGVIAVETLNVEGMKRNRRLARHISDAGWGMALSQLAYKTAWLDGSALERVDRYYPSSKTCSACGTVKAKLSLSERVFACDACGFSLNRDENAARNLAQLALAVAHARADGFIYVAATGAETPNARGATDPEAARPDGRPLGTAKAHPDTGGHPALDERAALAA
jgi:putative transposase